MSTHDKLLFNLHRRPATSRGVHGWDRDGSEVFEASDDRLPEHDDLTGRVSEDLEHPSDPRKRPSRTHRYGKGVLKGRFQNFRRSRVGMGRILTDGNSVPPVPFRPTSSFK